jgi:hypothetical protein
MRRLLDSAAIVLVGWALLVGCATKRAEPINVLADSPNEADLLSKAFQPASLILSGFDMPGASGEWRIGDRLLLGFQIDKDGRRTVRFVLIELKSGVLPRGADVIVIGPNDAPPSDVPRADAVPAPSAPKSVYIRLAEGDDPALIGRLPGRVWGLEVTMTVKGGREESFPRDSGGVFLATHVFDEEGRKMKTAGTLAPETYLRGGFFAACDLLRRRGAGETVDQGTLVSAYANLMPSLYGLGEVIRETPPLARIVQPIIPPQPFWALLLPGGLSYSFKITAPEPQEDKRPLPAMAGGRRAYLLPVLIDVNREPALQCVLSVADPSPPFHLCAGVVGIDGAQVQDPSCKFSMRLLAARRSGSPPKAAARPAAAAAHFGSSRPLVAAAGGGLAPTARQELGRYDGGRYSRP